MAKKKSKLVKMLNRISSGQQNVCEQNDADSASFANNNAPNNSSALDNATSSSISHLDNEQTQYASYECVSDYSNQQQPTPSNEFLFDIDVQRGSDHARALKQQKEVEARRLEAERRKEEVEDERRAKTLIEYANDWDSEEEDAGCPMTTNACGEYVPVVRSKKRKAKSSTSNGAAATRKTKYQRLISSSSESSGSSSSSSDENEQQYELFDRLPKHFYSECFLRSAEVDRTPYHIDFIEPINERATFILKGEVDFAGAQSLVAANTLDDQLAEDEAKAKSRFNSTNRPSARAWCDVYDAELALFQYATRGEWPDPKRELRWLRNQLEKLKGALGDVARLEQPLIEEKMREIENEVDALQLCTVDQE